MQLQKGSPGCAGFASGSRVLTTQGVEGLQVQRAALHAYSEDLIEPTALISACTCGHKVEFFRVRWYLDDSFSERLQICL